MKSAGKVSAFVLSFLICTSLSAQYMVPQKGNNLIGRISDGQRGIANVVVSDGFTTTLTDAEGVYQMHRSDSAKFVFISVPAEYKIPTDGSIPTHYKSINQKLETVYANFQLEKDNITNDFTLVAMADPQPSVEWELKRFRNETVKDIQELVSDLPEKSAIVGIALGDLTWDAPQLYPGYTDAVNEIPFPVLQVIGNHDHDKNVKNDDRKASHNFERYFGPTYYSYNKGQCHFIVLDDIVYNDRKSYQNKISEEQMAWLKQDLSYVDKDKLLIVGVHAPTTFRTHQLVNSKQFYEILDGYKAIILSGHTHNAAYTEISENITEYTLNAVFGSGWIGDINPRGGPNGYAILEVSGNRLKNEYFKATGHPSSYQMKLYPPGSSNEKKESVVANIWNWNQHWTVEVYENDHLQGNMEQYLGFDPYAYEYMLGPDKPRHRPKTEPLKSGNMFHYTPKKKNSVIKVVAKDEFGNTFTDEIEIKK